MAGAKTGENTQFARVADAAGNAPAGTSGAENDGLAPLCDDQGRLLVVGVPPGGSGGTILNYDSNGAEAAAVMLAAPGRLLYVIGFSTSGVTLYLQTYNQTTLPAGGELPVGMNLPIPPGQPFSVVLGPYGRAYSAGIAIGLSASAFGYADPGEAAGWYNGQVQA